MAASVYFDTEYYILQLRRIFGPQPNISKAEMLHKNWTQLNKNMLQLHKNIRIKFKIC